MAFASVNLSEIQRETISIPAGKYVFQLNPGATVRINKFSGNEELNLRFTVAEGDQAGRGIFFAYPDPTSLSKNGKVQSWSAQAMKCLEIALGVDSTEGETPEEYFNRVASNGNARFTANIVDDNYQKTDGTAVTRTKFQPFSVGPAA